MGFNISHNGSTLVATKCFKLSEKEKERRKACSTYFYKDEIEELYRKASVDVIGNKCKFIRKCDLKRVYPYVLSKLREAYPLAIIEESDVIRQVNRTYRMFLGRIKTLKRKVYMYPWNYFITITYDDAKFESEDAFRFKLLTLLNHLASRYGWRYFGSFEKGEIGERLHFHGVIFVPPGMMRGTITKQGKYSTKRHCYEYHNVNDYFAERFGHNEFDEVDQVKLRNRAGFSYITKYIQKDNEKLCYSKGAPALVRDVDLSDDVFVLDLDGNLVSYNYFGRVYVLHRDSFFDPIDVSVNSYCDDDLPLAS